MTNLQMMEEIRPMLVEIGNNLSALDLHALSRIHELVTQINNSLILLAGRHNTTHHCVQQLKKRHAELDARIDKMDRKVDDACCALQEFEDELDVRG